jgi:hypothetical protein
MPKKTKKGIAYKLRGQMPSARGRGRTTTRSSASGRGRGRGRASAIGRTITRTSTRFKPIKPRATPPKSKTQLSFNKNKLSQILEPKENYNLFLVKYKVYEGEKTKIVYRLFEDKKEIADIHQEKRKHLEQIFYEDNKHICKGIGQDFINNSYLESDISVLQFANTRTISRKSKVGTPHNPLGGIICFKNLKTTSDKHQNIYLDLICSRPGFGSNLLKIAEEAAKNLGKTRLFLRSVDTPLAFYLYKKYIFIPGPDTINLTGLPTFKSFFADPECQLFNRGRVYYPGKGTTVSLKNIPSQIRQCNGVEIIERVNGDVENGIGMYKVLV